MVNTNLIQTLSDPELLRRLSLLLSQSRRVEAELVAHIGEVDRRELFLSQACSSMYAYCVEVLHLSEAEAYLRIAVARAARRFPVILQMLGEERLHLSGIALLSSHLTEDNYARVLAKAAYRTKRQIEELVAELAPKPDAPTTIRKLPGPPSPQPGSLRPDRVEIPAFSMLLAEAEGSSDSPTPSPIRSAAPKPEPLSPERFKITFTASGELKHKLERLQALTQEDLVGAIEAAVTERLERLEAKRYGETKKPRKNLDETDTSAKSRYVPVAVRRRVSERDGKQCTFMDEKGRRCSERKELEFHHEYPYGLGGDHDPAHMRLLCRRHNLYLAERDYGKSVMDKYRKKEGRVSETAPAYGLISDTSHSRDVALRSIAAPGRTGSASLCSLVVNPQSSKH
jgi:hypothetical protein